MSQNHNTNIGNDFQDFIVQITFNTIHFGNIVHTRILPSLKCSKIHHMIWVRIFSKLWFAEINISLVISCKGNILYLFFKTYEIFNKNRQIEEKNSVPLNKSWWTDKHDTIVNTGSRHFKLIAYNNIFPYWGATGRSKRWFPSSVRSSRVFKASIVLRAWTLVRVVWKLKKQKNIKFRN